MMKIKGLAERHAQLGANRPSTAMVLGGAGSVRAMAMATHQKQAFADREDLDYAPKIAKDRPVKHKITSKNYIQR